MRYKAESLRRAKAEVIRRALDAVLKGLYFMLFIGEWRCLVLNCGQVSLTVWQRIRIRGRQLHGSLVVVTMMGAYTRAGLHGGNDETESINT